MKELFLVRHGKTRENITGILMGQLDSPLYEETKENIRFIKQYIVKPDIVYSSDLKRASETAQILFPNIKITLLSELRERHFGRLQGKPKKMRDKVSSDEPSWYQMDGDEGVFKNSGAETLSSVFNRAKHILNLIEKTDAKSLMVLGHGAFLSYMVNVLLGEGLVRHPLDNLHYHRIFIDCQGNVVDVKFNQNWSSKSLRK